MQDWCKKKANVRGQSLMHRDNHIKQVPDKIYAVLHWFYHKERGWPSAEDVRDKTDDSGPLREWLSHAGIGGA